MTATVFAALDTTSIMATLGTCWIGVSDLAPQRRLEQKSSSREAAYVGLELHLYTGSKLPMREDLVGFVRTEDDLLRRGGSRS